MKSCIISCLVFILLLTTSTYIALVEGILVWGIWNYVIVPIGSLSTLSYLDSVGLIVLPNFIFIGYKFIKFYKTL